MVSYAMLELISITPVQADSLLVVMVCASHVAPKLSILDQMCDRVS